MAEKKSLRETVTTIICGVGILWFIYALCFTATSPGILRPVFVMFIVVLGLLLGPRPGKSRAVNTVFLVIDCIFTALVIASTVYIIIDQDAWVMRAALVLISTLLSFTSNQFAIVPLLGPMAVVLGEAAGLSPATIIVCIIAGCNATGISPVSMGGSLQLIGANEEQRTSVFKKQWLTAVVVMLAMVLVSLLGVWKLIDGIFF